MLSESGDKQKKIVDNVDKSVYNCFFDEKQTKNNVDKSCVWVVVKLWIMCINENLLWKIHNNFLNTLIF